MINCSECNSYEPAGALYCSECGSFLLDTLDEEMTESQLPFTDALTTPNAPTLVGQRVTSSTTSSSMLVRIPSSGRAIRLSLGSEIKVGRSDPGQDVQPALDLTEDQGSVLGVSRLHATIRPSPEGVLLIDEGSTNGTYLNGYHLPPQLPYPLQSGDEVRFGRLLVHIFIE